MKEIVIDKKDEGKKLFRFIKSLLHSFKNREIFKILRKKTVTVNKKKQSPDYIIKNNDIIKIRLKEDYFINAEKNKKFHSIKTDLNVIFEDKDLLVINKDRGIETHASKNKYKNNLQEIVKAYLYKKNEYNPKDYFTPTPCHRLDRNTTGLIIIAKNHLSLKKITGIFRNRKALKKYLALACGKVSKKILLTSIINVQENQVAVNDFKCLEDIPDKEKFLSNNPEISATLISPALSIADCSLLNVELWTGKKHQIRAHLRSLDHPLLGDKKYFTKKSIQMSNKLNVNKYYLHSHKIKINGYEEFTALLPEDFNEIIIKFFGHFDIL